VEFEALVEMIESFPHAMFEYSFGPEVRVYKVGGKMFATLGEDPPHAMYLKADPDVVADLMAVYPQAVTSAPYMDKRMWIRVEPEGVPRDELDEWLEHSFELVVAKLTKKLRAELGL
jgi:predicted DNA-binding protein (MmcQ/YjbR family)